MDIYETKKYPILKIYYSEILENSSKATCLNFSKFICVIPDIALIREKSVSCYFQRNLELAAFATNINNYRLSHHHEKTEISRRFQPGN